MNFRDLENVIAVAKENNISRAAERLYISQPTLSQSIMRMEKAVGCRLFQRERQGLILTEEGQRFLDIAKKILELKSNMDEEMHNISLCRTSRIHLGISHSFSSFLLPKVLPKFNCNYPHIEIMIHNETSLLLEKMLLEGVLDAAVLVLDSSNDNLEYRTLFHEQILLAVSRDNLLSEKGILRPGNKFPYLSPELLCGQNFILSPEGMRLRQTAESFFCSQNITPDIAVTTASVETANRLASYNMGIAFIPIIFAMDNITPPSPLYFITDRTLPDWAVVFARRKNDQPNLMIDSLADALEHAFGETKKLVGGS